MKKHNHYTLMEHHSLYILQPGKTSEKYENGHIGLPKKIFEEIHDFVLQNSDEATQFLCPSYMKSLGQTLKAQQYVGVIETRSGAVVEILPKITDQEEEKTRKIFLKMLKRLRDSPFKHFNMASLKTEKMHLLEIFIAMFCEELAVLIRRGIKSDYIKKEENSRFLKGRLKLVDHIRKNVVHKERFYVEFDEYLQNRIENRIIRTTLEFLYKKSSSDSNKKRLREFLFVFNEIETVHDTWNAFKNVKIDRQMKDYEKVLHWCRLFLNNESFTSFKGNSMAFALLFDMNRVFEDYVAYCLKKNYPELEIKTQVSTEHLIIEPKKEFKLRPDLLVGDTVVADTKWKLLDSSKPHFGISQADLYQMYAYGKKYEGIEEVHLIYPKTEESPVDRKLEYHFDDRLILWVFAFDCDLGEIVGHNATI